MCLIHWNGGSKSFDNVLQIGNSSLRERGVGWGGERKIEHAFIVLYNLCNILRFPTARAHNTHPLPLPNLKG
jgi:hypothetical protein